MSDEIRFLLITHHSSLFSVLLSFRKFIVRVEAWHLGHVCDAASDGERDFCLLRHPLKIPGWIVLVRRLMIVRGVVCLELLFAPARRMADIILPLLQADGRHAHFGEREMIRTIERTLFGSRVR